MLLFSATYFGLKGYHQVEHSMTRIYILFKWKSLSRNLSFILMWVNITCVEKFFYSSVQHGNDLLGRNM